MKNTFDGLISRLDTPEERISELEDISIQTVNSEKQREQRLKQTNKQKQNRRYKDCVITTNTRRRGKE